MRSFIPQTTTLFLVLLTGCIGGIAAVIFHIAISWFLRLFYGITGSESFLNHVVTLPWYITILAPTGAGLLVGFIITRSRVPGIAGEGVSEVIEAIDTRGGNIDVRTAPLKLLLSAISIGGGGAGGREGPIIQMGASIGSSVGQWFKRGTDDIKTLIGSGAASIIGGTLHAPLTGICFAFEILLRQFHVRAALFIALGAYFGTMIAEHLLAVRHPLFPVDSVDTHFSAYAILLMLPLAIIAAGVAVLFSYMVHHGRAVFTHSHIPFILKPALGGALVGCIALVYPHVQEPASLGMIELLFTASLPGVFLIVFIILKMTATTCTLGSGGAGGVLMPSLLIGGSLGALYAHVVFPLGVPHEVHIAYILIGMGAFFSALAHAPLTATLLVIELTHLYILFVPLLIVCISANILSQKLSRHSFYHLLKNSDHALQTKVHS